MKIEDFRASYEKIKLSESEKSEILKKCKSNNNRKEEFKMGKRKYIPAIIATAVLLTGMSVFATYRLLNAKEVANILDDKKLAQSFDDTLSPYECVTDGNYKATVLGITSGENLSSYASSSNELFPEKTYVAVAIEHTDGSPMTYDDEILVSPLIEGLNPFRYNIFSMNGGYSANIIDGVLYRIVEFDSIEYFADRNVYIAVLSEPFLGNKSYSYDEVSGKISSCEDYDGTNMLIKLELDKSKANPEKAEEYLKELELMQSAENEESEGELFKEDTDDTQIIITDDMIK